jgi:hypothetical protein
MIRSSGHEKDSDGFYGKMIYNDRGQAGLIIRPVTIDNETPIVQAFKHSWYRGGKWFIVDRCAKSIDEPCPVCEHSEKLRSVDPGLAKERKAIAEYITNIVIISDPMRPQRVGQTMLIKLTKGVAEMLMDANDPNKYPPEGFDPWSPTTGRNFKLKAVKGGQYTDYGASGFVSTSSSLGNEDKIAAILTQCVPLASILVPSYTYDELADKYKRSCKWSN